MEIELMERLSSTTLQSKHLTHSRLKHLAATAQTSEDHVSRLGLGLSIAAGPVEAGWQPGEFDSEKSLTIEINEKHLRGKTLFKGDLAIWMALALRHQTPGNYDEWRQVMRAHWERGVEILMRKSVDEGDWLRTIRACLPVGGIVVADDPIVVDVLGLRCPIPVHHTRKALRDLPEGGVIHLLGDDPESLHDIPVLLERLRLPPAEISEAERGWVYVITNRNSE